MGFTGAAVPAPVTAAFTAARDARDAAVALIESAAAAGRPVHGWEADRAARAVIESAGFAAASCTAPATAWARRFTATAPTSTTTRRTTSAG